MTDRITYDVSPNDEQWTITKRGEPGPVDAFTRKRDAVKAARKLAKMQKPSQVVVRKRDGTIGFELTYGDDPFPPAG